MATLQTLFLESTHASGNRERVTKYPNPAGMIYALLIAYQSNFLVGENAHINFKLVAEHPNPKGLAKAVVTLKSSGLLQGEKAQIYVDALERHPDLDKFNSDISLLKRGAKLTEETIDALLEDYIVNQGRDITHSFKKAIAQRNNEAEDTHHLSVDKNKQI